MYVSSACLKPATHLAILYADRSEFSDRQRKSRANFVIDWWGHTRRFGTSISLSDYNQVIFRVRVRHFENSCDKIAQPDWLTLVAIRNDERKKSRERAHLANVGELDMPDIGDFIRRSRRKSLSLLRAHLAIFADRRSAYKATRCVTGFTRSPQLSGMKTRTKNSMLDHSFYALSIFLLIRENLNFYRLRLHVWTIFVLIRVLKKMILSV